MRTPGAMDLTAGAVVVAGEPGPEEDIDTGVLTGRHVLVVLPSGDEGRRRYRYIAGLRDAEPASFFIVDSSPDGEWEATVARLREQYRRVAPWDDGGADGPAYLTIREGSLAPILAAHGMDLAALRQASGFTVEDVPELEIALHTETRDAGSFTLPNTVGILEGSDPELRDEYIVFSAHMDHVGVGRPNEEGDSIRNGADDDASGTIAVVELAEAFSRLADRPRRSMIFLGVGGEEAGLLGSRYFVESPPVALTEMVANLNADMISRNAPDSIVVIGKEHSDLGSTLNRVADEHPELSLTAADDIWPEQNFYRRSDHFNFARRGVPVLFFFCGTHEDYHQPSDEVENMDISKATRVTRLMFYLGLEVANADEAPRWDPESRAEIVDMGG